MKNRPGIIMMPKRELKKTKRIKKNGKLIWTEKRDKISK